MAEPAAPADVRMSDVEALMWNLEKDPHLSSTFANVTIFDRPLDFDRLRHRMQAATVAVPRLRQRVVASLGRLAPPEWRDDPEFDIDFHLRRVAIPAPGSDRQLFDLAATLAADPFDRTRPLWEFTVIDGLDGGRGAMVQKMHHTITDGEGGVRMSVQFIDLERHPPSSDGDDGVLDPVPAEPPGRTLAAAAADAIGHNLRRQAGVARRTVEVAVDTATDPARLTRLPGDVAATVASLARQAMITDQRRSPLWVQRSLRRRFDVLRLPLDDAKRAAKALGGSVNDLFVAGAAGAAGAYHRRLGVDVDELRISMPVSTRSDRSAGGNAFTPTRVLVPVGTDPVERFAAIHERLSATKTERALGLTGALAGVMNVLPTSVLVRMARQQVETVDFATSNVRAAPFDLYIAGGLIVGNYPLGPVAGTAFNLTTMSYRGNLDMGLHSDAAAIVDPERLRLDLEEAFAELVSCG
jgi:WS/DGAT/MGAT family acyltransferase